MDNLKEWDILIEIYDLSREMIADIRNQLNYYRASVYKDETASNIENRIASLHKIVDIVPFKLLLEPFADYYAEKNNNNEFIPGECKLSARVLRLITNLEEVIVKLSEEKITGKNLKTADEMEFSRRIYENKNQIISACRPGSRRWSLFHKL